MDDSEKSKNDLIAELRALRERVYQLESMGQDGHTSGRARSAFAGTGPVHEALRQNEETYRTLFEQGADAVWIVDAETSKIVGFNDIAMQLHGYTREELQSLGISETQGVRIPQSVTCHIEKIIREGHHSFDAKLRNEDGELRDFHVSAGVLALGERKVIQIVAHDISDQVQAQSRLIDREQQYNDILEATPIAVTVYQDSKVIYSNSAGARLFGHNDVNGIIGVDILDYFPEREKERLVQHLKGCSEAKVDMPDRWLVNLKKATGKEFRAEAFVSLVTHEGRPATQLTILDVSDRVRALESLKESEERYRLLAENSLVGVYIHQDNYFVYVNDRFADLLGFTREEMTKKRFWEIFDPDLRDGMKQRGIARYSGENAPNLYESRIQCKNGRIRRVEVSATSVQYKGRAATLGTIADITDRKNAEAALRQREEELANVLNASPVGIGKFQDRKLLWGNRAMHKLFGFENEEEYVGQYSRILYPSDEEYERVGEVIYEGLRSRGEVETDASFMRKDGSVFDALIKVTVPDQSRPTEGTIVAISDLSHSKDLEKQLRRSQRMESIGTLAGGISHEFNNLLQIISGYTEILYPVFEETGLNTEDLDAISNAASRGTQLVRELLTFSRKVDAKLEPVDLNEIIRRSRELLDRTIPKMIDIETSLDPHLKRIEADSGQIEQVLVNLAVNARDAMPRGGSLSFETKNTILDEDFCRTHRECSPGEYVHLIVSDTGHGMVKEVLEHIFEPFFTTKGLAEGSGLGLSTVFGIVRTHGGYILCRSEQNKGTGFDLYFPVYEALAPDAETKQDPFQVPGGTETIFVVDDEPLITNLAKTVLERVGYSVITATSGREAIHVYRREGDRISLVILDLIMPKMGGVQCLEELLKIDPQVKAIIATGFPVKKGNNVTLDTRTKGEVAKPFKTKELLKTVRHALDEA